MARQMSKLTIIDEILHPGFKPENQNCLFETNLDDKKQKFTVSYDIVNNNKTKYLLYRFEQDAFPFFNDISGLKKTCDFILFAENDERFYVFVIELKKSNLSAEKQLRASEEFVKYILNSAKRIGYELISVEDVEIRRIRVCDKKIHRNRTKMTEADFEYNHNYCEYKYSKFLLAPLMQN